MLSCQEHLFQLPKNSTYLNCAFMSPMLKSVEKSGIRGLRLKRDPTLIGQKEFFEDSNTLRTLFAKLIGSSAADHVAIIPSVSYGLASAAHNIPVDRDSNSNIVIAHEQFPSNVYIWQRLAAERNAELRIVKPDRQKPPKSRLWNQHILDSIDAKTALVALSHVHWADGTRFDLAKISEAVHDAGGYLVVDGTQSVGALPFNVANIKPDALVVAGYKWLMGPFSIGLAWYSDRLLQHNAKPIEENWMNRLNSEDFSQLVHYQTAYQPGAARFEVGERSNFILVPMMITALNQILAWKPNHIQEYCRAIAADSVSKLMECGYVIEPPEGRGHHLFGIYPNDPERIDSLKKQLADANISVSIRGESIRVSSHLYNKRSDWEFLVKALTEEK